eukprot:4607080-Prymnesium_polylepis.1
MSEEVSSPAAAVKELDRGLTRLQRLEAEEKEAAAKEKPRRRASSVPPARRKRRHETTEIVLPRGTSKDVNRINGLGLE